MATRKTTAAAPVPKKRKAAVFSVRIDEELIGFIRAYAARERRPVGTQLEIILEECRARQEATERK